MTRSHTIRTTLCVGIVALGFLLGAIVTALAIWAKERMGR